MDPSAFDTLTRSFATTGTRRRLVALLAALPLGGVLTTIGADEAAAQQRPIDRLQQRTPQRNRQQRNQRRNNNQNNNKNNGGARPGPGGGSPCGEIQCDAGETCCRGIGQATCCPQGETCCISPANPVGTCCPAGQTCC